MSLEIDFCTQKSAYDNENYRTLKTRFGETKKISVKLINVSFVRFAFVPWPLWPFLSYLDRFSRESS